METAVNALFKETGQIEPELIGSIGFNAVEIITENGRYKTVQNDVGLVDEYSNEKAPPRGWAFLNCEANYVSTIN